MLEESRMLFVVYFLMPIHSLAYREEVYAYADACE
jgi:hypothetical protein